MYNLYDIPDIDWSKPWWEKSIQKFYSINGKLYFTYTPMQLHYYESLVTLLFNKEIADQYHVEDLYSTVKEGKWTLEKMATLATGIVKDLNGDGKIKPDEDLYGFTASNGHSLFFLDVLGRVKDLRNLKADFGILPMPKYDEAQKNYISANFIGASVLIVPSTNNEYMNIGAILERLGAYSYRDLIPAYYEVNIQGKQTRDEESVEMLNIMLSNISGDLSLVYGWGGLTDVYLSAVKNGNEIASKFKKVDKTINTQIDKWKEAF